MNAFFSFLFQDWTPVSLLESKSRFEVLRNSWTPGKHHFHIHSLLRMKLSDIWGLSKIKRLKGYTMLLHKESANSRVPNVQDGDGDVPQVLRHHICGGAVQRHPRRQLAMRHVLQLANHEVDRLDDVPVAATVGHVSEHHSLEEHGRQQPETAQKRTRKRLFFLFAQL